MSQSYSEKDLKKLFDRLDINKNGKVSASEIFNDFQADIILSTLTQTEMEEFITKYDLDKDGSVTFEEVKKAIKGSGINLTR